MPIPSIPGTCGLYAGARVTMTMLPERGAGTVGRRMDDGCWSVRFDTGDFGWWTPEVFSLLLDGWQSMCFAARYLATKLGCDPGSTAPKWYRIGDNDGPVAYELNCRHGKTVIVHDDDDGPVGESCGFIGLRVHGLPKDDGQPDLDAIVLAAAINALK